MELFVRWTGFALGLTLTVGTWRSIIGTIILPRFNRSFIAFATLSVVRTTFLFIANRQSEYVKKDRVLALLGPFVMLATLVSWMTMFLIGYALMFWPVVGWVSCLQFSAWSYLFRWPGHATVGPSEAIADYGLLAVQESRRTAVGHVPGWNMRSEGRRQSVCNGRIQRPRLRSGWCWRRSVLRRWGP